MNVDDGYVLRHSARERAFLAFIFLTLPAVGLIVQVFTSTVFVSLLMLLSQFGVPAYTRWEATTVRFVGDRVVMRSLLRERTARVEDVARVELQKGLYFLRVVSTQGGMFEASLGSLAFGRFDDLKWRAIADHIEAASPALKGRVQFVHSRDWPVFFWPRFATDEIRFAPLSTLEKVWLSLTFGTLALGFLLG